MNTPPQPEPDDEPPFTFEEFMFRLKHDPGFAGAMQRSYEAALALPEGPETADMQEAARKGLAVLMRQQGALHAVRLFERVRALMETPAGERPDIEGMEALTTEAIDHLLDVQEPERSRFMAVATGLRDKFRELRAAM